MQLLWRLEKANIATILQQLPEPKRAYKTKSTIIRIFEDKGFANHEKIKKEHVFLFYEKERYQFK